MDEEIKKLLTETIKEEVCELRTLRPESGEKSAAIDGVVKLYKLIIDEEKNELELAEKYERHEREEQLRKGQLAEQAKDRYIKLGLETAGIILPLIFYAYWMKQGFKFEETGTFTSTTFKGLFNRFRPNSNK